MKLHTLLLLCLAAVLYAAADKHVVAPPPVAVNDTPAVKVEPLAPALYLIEPFPRNSTRLISLANFPCGGIPKGRTHMLSTPGAHTIVQWKTVRPADNATCMIRLSNGIDNETYFVTLHPRDGSADSEGRFPCGRYPNAYETKEFILPEDLSCERCTLQLVWEAPTFTQHHCADVTLMSDQVKQCMGKCQNAGACVNGKCVCQDLYYGPYCEHKQKITFEMGYWWLVYAVLILLIIGFIGAALYIKKQMNEAKSHVQQPLTDQPPEEAKHVELGNEQEEQEPVNPEAKWQAESQLLPGGPVSDSREIGTSLKPASAGPAPAEVKKDQPFNM